MAMASIVFALLKSRSVLREGHAEEHPPFTATTGCNQANSMLNKIHIDALQEKVASLEKQSSRIDQLAAGEESNRSSINAILKKLAALSPVSALKGPGLTRDIPGVTSSATSSMSKKLSPAASFPGYSGE